jgi:hypothetical protein
MGIGEALAHDGLIGPFESGAKRVCRNVSEMLASIVPTGDDGAKGSD